MQNYRTDKKLYFFFCKRKTNWITIKQNWSSSNALLLEVKFSYVTINHDFKLWFLYHGGLAVVNCPCTCTRLARKRTLAQREFQCLKSCLRKTRGEIGSVEWYRWRKSLLRVNFCIYQAQKKNFYEQSLKTPRVQPTRTRSKGVYNNSPEGFIDISAWLQKQWSLLQWKQSLQPLEKPVIHKGKKLLKAVTFKESQCAESRLSNCLKRRV